MFTYFNHQQLYRYILAFGTVFNTIQITRSTPSQTIQRITVPIEFASKKHWYTRLVQDPAVDQSVSQTLPRMAYEITNIDYDASRKINTINRLQYTSDELRKQKNVYVGVPYIITFQLSLLSKFNQDAMQVVEQIFPYFTPNYTFLFKPMAGIDVTDQIPLILTSSNFTDNYDDDLTRRQIIIWNMTFQMKTYFYGPIRQSSRIQEVIVDIYNSPLASTLEPPTYILGEDASYLIDEDETGYIMNESTDDLYFTYGRTARVTSVAYPEYQTTEPFTANTVLTEYDGDVKRNRLFADEEL